MFADRRLLFICLLSLFLSACFDTPGKTSTVNTSLIFSAGQPINGLQVNRKIEVFSDQTSFNTSFAQYVFSIAEHTVDFNTRRVVLLSMGSRPSGGYSIVVDSAEDFGDYVQLNITLSIPGNGCVVTLALTSPYTFIEIESTKNLIFKEQVSVYECAP